MNKNIFKTIILVSLFIFCGIKKSSAQGNLQFNQVILYDFAANGTQAINIPAGKVWKIETANSFNGGNTGIIIRNAAVQPFAALCTSVSASTNNYPFWLPSGFVGSFLNGTGSGRACISIIEFNVVP